MKPFDLWLKEVETFGKEKGIKILDGESKSIWKEYYGEGIPPRQAAEELIKAVGFRSFEPFPKN